MLIIKSVRILTLSALVILFSIMITSCSKETDTGYKIACHGEKLTAETREIAIENGWQINITYDCVDKALYDKLAVLHYSETVKESTLKSSGKSEIKAIDRSQKLIENERYIADALMNMNTLPVEANTAHPYEIGNIVGVGNEAGWKIKRMREEILFTDWDDLLARVPELKAGDTAHDASVGGLTVNGESFPSANHNPKEAIAIYEIQLRKLIP